MRRAERSHAFMDGIWENPHALSRLRTTSNTLLGNSRDRLREIARGKRIEIVDALADADIMHRQGELVGQRHEDAAARRAVELGHDEAGYAGGLAEDLDLRERVLAH